MKISKLLLLGTLLLAICITGQAIAARIPGDCTGNGLIVEISRPEPLVYPSSIVEYWIRLANGVAPQCQKTSVYIYFYPPDVSQPVNCRIPGAGAVLIAGPLTLNPGDEYTYDSTDNSALAFPAPASGDFTAFACAFGDGQTRPGGTDLADADNEITTSVINPVISIIKSALPVAICEGDENVPVTYTYLVSWGVGGDTDMTDVVVTDNMCGPVVRGLDNPGNDNAWLESGEIWEFTCDTTVSGETTNTATVNANDILGNPVTPQQDPYTVTVNLPPVVRVNPPEAAICDDGEVQLCAEIAVDTGTPPFTYEWTKVGSPTVIGTDICITVSEAGTYRVTVTDAAGCNDDADSILTVIPTPVCSIDSGPTSLCEEDIGIPVEYCSDVDADNFFWEIVSGPATIQGGIDDQMCVDVVPTGLGTIVLKLTLSNNVPGDGVCEDFCQISITVEECGGAYCTFTQGYWGNEGGTKCGGKTTTLLINQALTAAGGSIVVGVLGERSITFSSAADIILRLPCGGTPSALPEGLNVNANNTAALKTAKLLKKKDDRINNVLVGQVVALTLNLLVSDGCIEDSGDLGNYTFPEADYICVQKGEDGCIRRYAIPESLQGLSVEALLETANLALAGDEELVGGAYDGASFVNELFDECMTIVACPPEDSCDYCDADPLTCVD